MKVISASRKIPATVNSGILILLTYFIFGIFSSSCCVIRHNNSFWWTTV